MKKRRRKKSRQGKRYSQINFVSTLQLNFFSPCSKKIRIRHFVLFLAHYVTLASDSFTIATLAVQKGGKTPHPPSVSSRSGSATEVLSNFSYKRFSYSSQNNGAFPSSPQSLFQNKTKCENFVTVIRKSLFILKTFLVYSLRNRG